MHWNFSKKVSKLPVSSYGRSLMTGCITFGPTGLMVALDISTDGEVAWFSRGPLTDMTGGCIRWASGMKPALKHSSEVIPNDVLVVPTDARIATLTSVPIVDVSLGLWAHGRALQYLTRWLSAVA